ncbi:MAG: LamG domain-containing protein [Anaerolineaceae bacterium]|nr:LamG domain-containing protein [Anaerolineaceae bacterium]
MSEINNIVASALSANIPEPTSYSGKHYIKLPFRGVEALSDKGRAGNSVALAFDGQSSFVSAPGEAQQFGLDAYAIEAWVKLASTTGLNPIFGVSVNDLSGGFDHPLLLTFQNGFFIAYHGSTPHFLGSNQEPYAAGQWYHIAYSYRGSERRSTLYVNGEEKGTVEDLDSELRLQDVTVGRSGPVSTARRASFFHGEIDRVRVWDRHLTAANVTTMMFYDGISDSQRIFWDFEEGRGNVAQNLAALNNDPFEGELRNTQWVLSSRPRSSSPHELSRFGPLPLTEAAFLAAKNRGSLDRAIFPEARWIKNPDAVKSALEKLEWDPWVEQEVANGNRLRLRHIYSGELRYDFVPRTNEPEAEFVLIEHYRLSTFRGAYGPGRILNTFSLLPGEKTEISISTYTNRATDITRKTTQATSSSTSSSQQVIDTNSIFDSATKETADRFATDLNSEVSLKSSESDSFDWSVGTEGSVSGGMWSASASASAGGNISSARESLATNVSNVSKEHASQASAMRHVNVNTHTDVQQSREQTQSTVSETEESTSISSGGSHARVRTIENINVSRTLNFVFRQMNQEYLTLLHLVDLQVGFQVSGQPETRRIVPLSELQQLLNEVVEGEQRLEMYEMILQMARAILDYNDEVTPDFIGEVTDPLNPNRTYHRVNRKFATTYDDSITQQTVQVPGIIVNVDKIIMRTDHVYVDAFLGMGEALDAYSQGLQKEAIENEQLHNELLRTEVARNKQLIDINKAAMQIVSREDSRAAAVFKQVFGDAPTSENGVALLPTEAGE